jgi:hypothetical protein
MNTDISIRSGPGHAVVASRRDEFHECQAHSALSLKAGRTEFVAPQDSKKPLGLRRPTFALSLFTAVATCLIVVSTAFAQSSATSISFQGALNGANGQPLANGSYNLAFRFWDGPAPGGIAVSTNILVPNVPVANGLASTAIPVDPAWFNGQARYLGVSINGGNELLPRVLVTAVPYAVNAQSVRNSPGMRSEAVLENEFGGDPTVLTIQSRFYGKQQTQTARFEIEDGGVSNLGLLINNKGSLGGKGDFNILRVYDGSNAIFDVKGDGITYAARLDLFQDYFDPLRLSVHSKYFGKDNLESARFTIEDAGIDGLGLAINYKHSGGGTSGFDILRAFHGPEVLFAVNGNGKTTTRILQITGGADLAEHFSVNDSNANDEFQVEPGMVVSIDPTGNRKFKLSDSPYDKKRVGIISGGNGVKPGLVLQDEGNSAASGDQPIALTGQVWCHADTSFGPIEPGDLLTTSSTPGHAMKVTDFDKARFAVLGQALTGLKEGRGWVQVLVGKQ